MVAASESLIQTKVPSSKKVSKPLMEKKRRARINTCLDQLKTLLESFYSNNIRKRKFEKADILELTVKHLKHLQTIEKGFSINALNADYEAGFRTCLAGVSQFLLMNNRNPAYRAHNTHTHLSHRLQSLSARLLDSSTVDSDASGHYDVMFVALPGCQKAQRNHRTETSKKDKASGNGLQQHKHVSVNPSVQQNYWRPW